jgi:hypothetical protein
MVGMHRRSVLAAAAFVLAAGLGHVRESRAATISWKGHTWQLTSGGMAGVCQGDPQNVSVNANGYLHLRITNSGGTWTAAELFTTDRLGFGTYQWQVDGPIDSYDKNVVLGLFPYGPAAGVGGDGTNEIDIEYARWGQANGPNGDWTDYPASGTTVGEKSYTFSLGGGTLSTSRFVWSSTSIANALLGGLQPLGSTTGLIDSWTYAPSNPTTNIPQQSLPLGMNLWCFDAPPSNGQPVEIVIRDFVYVSPDSAGGGGAGGTPTGSGGQAAGGAGGRAEAGGAGGGLGGAIAGSGGIAGSAGMAGGGGASGANGGATGAGGRAGATGSGVGGGGGAVTTHPAGGASPSGCSCALNGAPRKPGVGIWLSVAAAVLASRRRGRRGGGVAAR